MTIGGAEMGRRTEKSSFTMACSLLSQFIKEKGCLAVPARVLDSSPLGKPEPYQPPTTMSLLPGVDISGNGGDDTKEEESAPKAARSMELFPQRSVFGPTSPPAEETSPEKSQLTIFYGGKVLVFDNFPAEKAKDLMQLASKGQNFVSEATTSMATAPVAELQSCPAAAKPPTSFPARAHPIFSDLPIARKASLHRFLEKRRDRICAKAPYQLSSSSSGFKDAVAVKKEEISNPWLGLSSNCST